MANEHGSGPAEDASGDTIAPAATIVDDPLAGTEPAQPVVHSTGPPKDVLLGRTIAGRYEITERIGAGGMGVVYKAYQASMDRHIALKVLSASLAADDVSVRRFNQEARAASRLSHPNTITLHDFGKTDDDILFIAMELLDGISLDDALRATREEGMPVSRAITLMAQVCRSLAEAHDAGIIHRDLKPDNIFLCNLGGETDFVKVLDFGVAKLREAKQDGGTLTQAGMIFGTPRYMSPEQAQSLPLDRRSDLYALGVILYEMMAGHAPFVAESPLSILIQHVHEQPPPFSQEVKDRCPPRLEKVIFDLLDKDPEKRPTNAKDLLARLLDVAAELALATGEAPAAGMSGLTDIKSHKTDPNRLKPGVPTGPGGGAIQGQPGLEGGVATFATAQDATPSPLGDPGAKGDTWDDKNTPSDPWAFAVGDRTPRGPKGASVPVPVALAAVGVIALAIGGFVVFGGKSTSSPAGASGGSPTAAGAATPTDPKTPAAVATGAAKPADTAGEEKLEPKKAEAAAAKPAERAPAPPKPAPVKAAVVQKRTPRPPPKPKVEKVSITIATIPAGAKVLKNGRMIGLTPHTIDGPKAAKTETFRLTKNGYKPASTLIVWSKTTRVTTRLTKESGP